jgi:hypothetical protein
VWIGRHRHHPPVIPQTIATDRLELVDEQPGWRRPLSLVACLVLQDFQAGQLVELRTVFFRPLEDEGLKRSEIVRQQGHSLTQSTMQPNLPPQELDDGGQPGGRKHLFVNGGQHLLSRQILEQPFAKHPEKIHLLDVLLAIQPGLRGGL